MSGGQAYHPLPASHTTTSLTLCWHSFPVFLTFCRQAITYLPDTLQIWRRTILFVVVVFILTAFFFYCLIERFNSMVDFGSVLAGRWRSSQLFSFLCWWWWVSAKPTYYLQTIPTTYCRFHSHPPYFFPPGARPPT